MNLVFQICISSHLISSFLSNRWLEYTFNVGISQGFIFGLTLFLLHINNLSEDVICSIATYADDTTFYSKFDQAF